MRDLRRDRNQQVDLFAGEVPRRDRADVQRAGKPLAREDRHGENRLVLVLGQIRERLEPRIEMGLRRDHHGLPLRRGDAGDPLARPHPRPPCHLLDARPVRRAEHELVRALVVEIDEAGVGAEGVRHLARDERENLL